MSPRVSEGINRYLLDQEETERTRKMYVSIQERRKNDLG